MSELAPKLSRSDKGSQEVKNFECRVCARDLPGEIKVITVQAPDPDTATQNLLAQGYVVIKVREQGKKKISFPERSGSSEKSVGLRSPSFFDRVTIRECIFFAVQLATLLKAGIPLLRGLEIIQKGIRKPFFKQVLQHLRKRVSEGGSFSGALKLYPSVFPWIWVNLVEVGEATGKLPDCLEEIAHYQEAAVRIKGKVITAFFYPGVLTLAVTAALTFLLTVIVPKFKEIFETQKMTLPPLTKVVVGASDVLTSHFFLVAGCIAALVVALVFTRKVPVIKLFYDRVALDIPMMGKILMQVAVVRFTRSLGTLLRAGVPILQSLEISGRLVGNQYIERSLKHVRDKVQSGQGLGGQLESRKIFPVFMTQLVAVGEESGQLDRFLDMLAGYYEDLVDSFLARLTTLMEPFLLIFMGSVIGTIVISMFLPIVDLSTRGMS